MRVPPRALVVAVLLLLATLVPMVPVRAELPCRFVVPDGYEFDLASSATASSSSQSPWVAPSHDAATQPSATAEPLSVLFTNGRLDVLLNLCQVSTSPRCARLGGTVCAVDHADQHLMTMHAWPALSSPPLPSTSEIAHPSPWSLVDARNPSMGVRLQLTGGIVCPEVDSAAAANSRSESALRQLDDMCLSRATSGATAAARSSSLRVDISLLCPPNMRDTAPSSDDPDFNLPTDEWDMTVLDASLLISYVTPRACPLARVAPSEKPADGGVAAANADGGAEGGDASDDAGATDDAGAADAPPVHKSSVVGTFFIFLLIGLVLYTAIGCWYKRTQLGEEGFGACPHSHFWATLPAVIVGGCLLGAQVIANVGRALCDCNRPSRIGPSADLDDDAGGASSSATGISSSSMSSSSSLSGSSRSSGNGGSGTSFGSHASNLIDSVSSGVRRMSERVFAPTAVARTDSHSYSPL